MTTVQQWNRYVIDPRNYRTYWVQIVLLIVFWLLWTPGTIIATFYAFSEKTHFLGKLFLFLWLIAGYFGVIVIPYSIFNMRRKQIVKIEGDTIVVEGARFLPFSIDRIHKQDLKALTLETYSGETDTNESTYTLNLWQKHGKKPKRVTLADFVHPRDKSKIFQEISGFLHSNGFAFEEKNEMARSFEPFLHD